MRTSSRRPPAPRRSFRLALACALLAGGPGASAENVTLTTYYPAPSGVYTQLIATQNVFLARDGGKVGIGTSSPAYKLDVNGDMSATTLHVQTLTGITNLNVSGYVTAGGTLTGGSLQSNGDAFVNGRVGVNMAPNGNYRLASAATSGQWAGYFYSPTASSLYSETDSPGSWAGYFNGANASGLYAFGGNGYGVAAYSSALDASYSETTAGGRWASYNYADNGYGVYGYGGNGIGVYGVGNNNIGVYGQSSGSWAGYFFSPVSHGLYAESDAAGGYWSGYFYSPNGYGVYGYGGNGIGVYGQAANGNWAGEFIGSGSGYGVYGQTAGGGGNYYAVEGYNPAAGTWGLIGYGGYAFYGAGYLYGSGGYVGSDRRLKDDIQPLPDPLAVVDKLQPVSYAWKPNTDQRHVHGDQRDYGFIAQDVEKILPEIVRDVRQPIGAARGAPETLNEKLGTTKAIDYERVIPFVAGAVQQLHRQNRQLERENRDLQKRVDELEQRLTRLESGKPLD